MRRSSHKNQRKRPHAARSRVRRVSLTDLRRNLGRVIARVEDRDEPVIVERDGRPVCQIVPAPPAAVRTLGDLVEYMRRTPGPGKEWADRVAEGVASQPVEEIRAWPS